MPRDESQDHLGDRERIAHMLAAARDAFAFAQGRTREDLDHDRMLRRALVNCVQEIGEAASRVSDAGRTRASDLPWPKMVGMRHILVHAYYSIDVDAVWRVVDEHLPELVEQLEAALSQWDSPPTSDDGEAPEQE